MYLKRIYEIRRQIKIIYKRCDMYPCFECANKVYAHYFEYCVNFLAGGGGGVGEESGVWLR